MGFLLGDGHGAKICERTGRTVLPVARDLKEGILVLGKDFEQYIRHRAIREEREEQRQYQQELLQRTHDSQEAQSTIDDLSSDLREVRDKLFNCVADRADLERNLGACLTCAEDLTAARSDADTLTKGFVAAYEFAVRSQKSCTESFLNLKYSQAGAAKKCDAGTVPEDAQVYLAAQANHLRTLPSRSVEQEAILLRIDALVGSLTK